MSRWSALPSALAVPRHRDDVLAAARELLDEEGIGSLTMANVASRVGFTTMAVYRHVKNRDDLVHGVLELVLHEIADQANPDADWLDGIERWMRDVRAHLVAHPWAATMLGSRTTMTPAWAATVGVLQGELDRSPLSSRARRVRVCGSRGPRSGLSSRRSVHHCARHPGLPTTRSSTTL